MEIGIDSFAGNPSINGVDSPSSRMHAIQELLECMALSEEVGLDVFGLAQHFRRDFLDSAPTLLLTAAAARTSRIKLTS